jgi:hypothetical protein
MRNLLKLGETTKLSSKRQCHNHHNLDMADTNHTAMLPLLVVVVVVAGTADMLDPQTISHSTQQVLQMRLILHRMGLSLFTLFRHLNKVKEVLNHTSLSKITLVMMICMLHLLNRRILQLGHQACLSTLDQVELKEEVIPVQAHRNWLLRHSTVR